MKRLRIETFGSAIKLKSRFQRLLDIADSDYIKLNTIEFRWSGPEIGWLDLEVLCDGEIVLQTSISSIFKPFQDLIPWLHRLAESRTPCSVLEFDIEGFYMEICCDYLGKISRRNKYEDVALFTLAHDWDESLNHAYFVLPVHDFIRKLYYSLQDHFMKHQAVFMQEWMDYEYNENCLALIEAELTCKELEKLVPRIGKRPEIPLPNVDIPVTEAAAFCILDSITSNVQENELAESDLYRWICDNWIFSLPGEDESVRGKRASCFMMMSDGKIEYDYEWCFSDAEHVVHLFLERYSEYRRSDNKRDL